MKTEKVMKTTLNINAISSNKSFVLNRNNKQKVRVINSIFPSKYFLPRLLRKNFHFLIFSYLAFRSHDNRLRNLPARLVLRPLHDNRSHSLFALCRANSLYAVVYEQLAPVGKVFFIFDFVSLILIFLLFHLNIFIFASSLFHASCGFRNFD